MNRIRKIYTSALLGALGGLLAAVIHRALFVDPLGSVSSSGHRLFLTILLGICIGFCIGFFPSFAEGLGRYEFSGAVKTGLTGAPLGGIGGILLGFLEPLYYHSGGGILSRCLGLGSLGALLGVAESITGRIRWWRGVMGGLVGGVFAGALLQLLPVDTLNNPESDAAIWALMLIGLSIALFVALFVNMFAECWLEGISGPKVSGHTYQLSGLREPNHGTMGSGKKCFIWIPDVRDEQASISITGSGTRLQNLGDPADVRVNGNPVKTVILKNGNQIEMGPVKLRYCERRRVGVPLQQLQLNRASDKAGDKAIDSAVRQPGRIKILPDAPRTDPAPATDSSPRIRILNTASTDKPRIRISSDDGPR